MSTAPSPSVDPVTVNAVAVMPPASMNVDLKTKFGITDEQIAELAETYLPLTIDGLDDKEGYEQVHAAHMKMRRFRTSTDKIRQELNSDALAWQRTVNDYAKEVTAKMKPIEDHLAAEKHAVKQAKLEIERAEKEAAKAKLRDRARQLTEVEAFVLEADLAELSDEAFGELLAEKQQAHQEKLAEAERAAKEKAEREAAEAAQRKAEQERIDAEKAKVDAEQARLAEAKKKQQAEADKLQAEREAFEAEKREQQRLADEAIAEKEAAQRAEQEAAEKAEREKQAEELRQQQEKEKQERLKAMRPESEKIDDLATDIIHSVRQYAFPVLDADTRHRVGEIVNTCVSELRSVAAGLRQ